MVEQKVPIESELVPVIDPELEDTKSVGVEDLTADKIEKLETAVQNYRKVIGIVCKLTTPNDWVDQGGKPYLQSSGAEKIAVPFGIDLTDKRRIKHERKDEKGSYYFYEYNCKAFSRLLGRSIEAEGFRSSRDDFFAMDKGSVVPQSEIDESEIMRAAYSNMTVNAITRLIGVRNLTWEMVVSFGIDRSKVSSIKYDRGFSQNAPSSTSAEDLEAKRKQIGEWLMELNEGDEKRASKHLEELTSFKGKDGKEVRGKKSLIDLSPAAIPVIYGKTKVLIEEKSKAAGAKQ